MRDFEFNFLFNRSRHPVKLPKNRAIHNPLATDGRDQSRRFRKANRGEQLAQLPSIRLSFLDFSVPVVQRTEQGFPKGKTPLLHNPLM
jgi:hypothetical protein